MIVHGFTWVYRGVRYNPNSPCEIGLFFPFALSKVPLHAMTCRYDHMYAKAFSFLYHITDLTHLIF